ncbi:MAG: ribose-phosphate pyrophosphokinase [Nitrososphaerales archaeon]
MSKEICVIAGPASKDLARSIAEILVAEVIDVELKVFPDGESKVRIDGDPSGKFSLVVQSTYPPVNAKLLEALFTIRKASKMGADVCAVIPYLAYARQDKEFVKGEAISMESIASIFDSSGAKSLITVDIHSEKSLSFFTISAYNVSAVPLLANYFKSKNLVNPIVVSPDIGGGPRAEDFAKILNTESIALPKHRDRSTGEVRIVASVGVERARDRDAIIVDDMISTGGSIVKAAEVMKEAGCKDIYVACTHALLLDDALDRIKNAGVKQVVGTNTVPSQVSKVDVAPVICDQVKKL